MKNKIIKRPKKERKHIDYGRILFMGFLCVTIMAGSNMQAFAATTVWEKANEIMKDVYNQILFISDTVDRKPYKAPDDTIAYKESIVKMLPDPPRRKDRV